MYRRSSSGGLPAIIVAIFLGLVAGVVYLVYDSGLPTLMSPATGIVETLPPTTTTGSLSTTHSASLTPTILPTGQPTTATEITEGARFLAPTAGINTRVVEAYLNGNSWDVADLGTQVGHLEGTAWIQKPGNIVLAGHVEMADGRAGIFANINQMSIGDPLYIRQNGEERVYQIMQLFLTRPDDLTVLYPSQTEKLTLITCSNYDFFADQYRDRFIVIADRVN